ncbi:MAG: glycosyltransferase family 2 protein [Prevotellaceae bacterium]|jgi:glycosyltransferase involved in cell wall biosynthesis|nr:glycosyltransferase family 2 protein [Prevotellaceae bacterium]
MKVSIIVPCYNLAQYLPETLNSVLAQTYQNWECIIVNDGSPDNTEEIAKVYCAKDERFRYFYKENSGVSDTRNFGIKQSSGEYILPLDADDIIAPVYLKKAIERFLQVPETAVVFSEGVYFGEYEGKIILKDFDYKTLLFENTFFCPVFFKRKDFDKTKGYNTNHCLQGWEDWEIMFNLLNETSIVYKIPEICYFYRIRKNSLLGKTRNKELEMFNLMYADNKAIYNKFFQNPMLFGFLLQREINEKEIYKNALKSIKNSQKYKLAQKISKLAFWKK